jgi:hypothetical protein
MLACAKLRRSVIACAGIDTRTMTARNCSDSLQSCCAGCRARDASSYHWGV